MAAARLRDVGGSLVAALRWRRTARQWQRGGSSAVAATRWLQRWRQRDIVMSAAAWRRRAKGNDNEDDDDGDGDGAMGSGVKSYDDDD